MPTDPGPPGERFPILLAHADDETRATVRAALLALDHEIVAETDRADEIVRLAQGDEVRLLVSGVDFPDGDAIDAMVELGRREPIPAIIITDRSSLQTVERALADHVMAYLIEPVTADDLRPTILLVMRRFEEFRRLRDEVRDLSEALEARKLIERAKGLVMTRRGVTEDEAYHRLRRMATDRSVRMVDIARSLVDAEELLEGE